MDKAKIRAEISEHLEKATELLSQAKEIEAKYESDADIPKEDALEIERLLSAAETEESLASRKGRMVKLDTNLNDPARPVPFGRIEVGEDRETERSFNSLGEQLTAVAKTYTNGVKDPRLNAGITFKTSPTGASESISSDGGFLVQTDFATELFQLTHETGQVASRCRMIPVSANSNSIKINGVDETSRADGSRWGGVRAYWTDEAGSPTKSKPKFYQMTLAPHKLSALMYATDELLSDSMALEAVVRTAFSEEMGFKLDNAIINGTGAGQPLGVLNAGCVVSVAKETGQAATTLVAENLEKMYSRMHPRSVPNAIWLINQDVWPQLFQLSHAVGTGGVPVFVLPNSGIVNAPFGTLLGRPVVPIEQCATLGTVGDVILADLSQYALAEKGGMQSAVSIHVKFVEDETAFRFTMRVDGQPLWKSALTPFKGSATQSPFITLATRS